MKQTAEIMTHWIGDGTDANPNRPAVVVAYSIDKMEDITGTPAAKLRPAPNGVVVRVVAEDSVLDAIDADPDYIIIPGTREDV